MLRDLEYFVQFMGDEENGNAARLQFTNQSEQGIHFFFCETCRRLVHDNEACVIEQCTADRDHLAHAKG